MRLEARSLLAIWVVVLLALAGAGCWKTSSPGADGGGDGADGEDAAVPDEGTGTDGADDAGGADEPDGGDGSCVVADPLALTLQITGAQGELSLTGAAQVIYKGRDAAAGTSQAWLFFADQQQLVKVIAGLPSGLEIPISLGDQVEAAIVVEMPWWISQSVELRDAAGLVRFAQFDRDFNPQNPLAICPAREDNCGLAIHPTISLQLDDSRDLPSVELGQGDSIAIGVGAGKPAIKFQGGRIQAYLTMDCDDVPMGWEQVAVVDNTRYLQCQCQGNADCPIDFVCDPYVGRCLRDQCVAADCGPDQICDPFTGQCQDPPHASCHSAVECRPANTICHPVTHRCVDDICSWVDCDGPCSSLWGGCVGCFSDCDCQGQICDVENRVCVPGCDTAKVKLTQENPAPYDYAVFCVRNVLTDPQAYLALNDPLVTCQGVAPGACADADSVLCTRTLVLDAGTTRITDDLWGRICAQSRLPLVSEIFGMYGE